MLAVRGGDLAALATLFERHHRALFNYFLHISGSRDHGEDLVQDVFFRILKYRRSFDPDQPFRPWMYRIARSAHADLASKRRLETALGEREFSVTSRVDEGLRQQQEISLLQRALARLPAEKREILVLSRFQNLKHDEIASMLGCEVGAVKVRVYRAVRALGQIYMELSGERAS